MKTNILNNMVNNVRVWAIIMICLTVFGVGNAWGTDVTFTFNTDAGIAELGITKPSSNSGTSLDTSNPYELSGVSMAVTHGSTDTRVWNGSSLDLRVYASGGSLTFTAPRNITKVVISGTTVNGFSANVGTYTTSSGEWVGDAASVTFTAGATQKVNTITVTYTSDPHTVTFNKEGGRCNTESLTEASGGAGVTLPAASPSVACAYEGWEFAGWAAATCSESSAAPRLYVEGITYYPADDVTLHAVYRKEVDGTSTTTATFTASTLSGLTTLASNETTSWWWLHTASGVEFYINNYAIYDDAFDIYETGEDDGWAVLEAHRRIKQVVLTLSSASYSVATVIPDDGTAAISTSSTTQTITCTGDVTLLELYPNTTNNEAYISAFTVTYYNTTFDSNPSCCDKIVELSAGTKTNVSDITFSETSVPTCSDNDGYREVTVYVTPSTGYLFKSGDELTWTKSSGTIPAAPTLVSGPTLNAGKYEFVYRFAQDDNGAGTFAATASTYTNYLTRCGYLITYDCNSETSGCPTDVERAFRLPSPLPSAPTKTGYSFAGWYTDASFSSAAVAGATLSDNITLYAKWTQSVKLHDNNGDSHSGSTTATFNAGGPLSVTAPTRTGYSVEGYYAEVGCTNKVMTDEGALVNYSGYVESSKWIHSGATTLYTKWSPNTNTAYTVKHYQQKLDGTYPSTPTETENLTGTTAASVTPAVKSYTGFTAPSTQTVTILADGSRVVEYKYTRNSYTLAWALDGGSISSAGTAAGSVKYGAPLTAPTVTKTGYTFSSWSPSVPATMPAANSTYTAQWSANTITITWNANGAGATVSPTSNDYTYDGATVSLPTPTRLLYAFDGWYTDASGGTQITEIGTTNKPTADVTYYAHWRALTFEIKDQAGTGTADIHLTSTNGVTVNATSACGNLITIKANNLDAISNLGGGTANKQNIQIKYLDANNGDAEVAKASSPFRLCYNGSPNYNVADGSNINLNGLTEYSQTYSISYTPSGYGKIDHYKLQLRLQNNTSGAMTITLDLYGRALPEEFVVVAKYDDDNKWYALPNTLATSSGTNVTPVEITVDNTTTPTVAKYAPTNTVYKAVDRYKPTPNTQFASIRLSSDGSNHLQAGTSDYSLWLNTGNAVMQNWYLQSADFGAYTVKSDPANSVDKVLGFYTQSGIKMGFHTSAPKGHAIYFLPIENELTLRDATVTEWGQHSVVLAVDASDAHHAKAHVENGTPTANQTITPINTTADKAKNFKVPVGSIDLADLTNNEGKMLYIDWENSSNEVLATSIVRIPRIIAADRDMKTSGEPNKSSWAGKEVHVLPGATLTANTNSYAISPGTASIRELHIYPGATLNVSTGTLTVTTLRLRNGWTRAGDKQYNSARVYVASGAALTKTTASMDYDIYELSEGKHYYPLAVPFTTAVNTIDYADTYLAGFSTYGTHYVIKEYDGANRASSGPDQTNNWDVVSSGSNLTPGKGYIMTAVAVKGEAIIRVPLTYDNGWTANGELATYDAVTKNVVSVSAYGGDAATAHQRHKGWNMLGVPFMSCYGAGDDMYSDGTLINGELVVNTDADENMQYQSTEIPYVSVPSHDFAEYVQTDITEAKLLPGWSFFVQVSTDGNLTFAVSNRRPDEDNPIYAPQRTKADEVVRTGIILSDGNKSDKTTLLISDMYSAAEYEINADLEKMFGDGYTLTTYSLSGDTRLAYNAMNTTDAKGVIPIGFRAPEDGEYTFSLNPRYADAPFERVDLIDYLTGEVTNLMMSEYTFATGRTQDDSRFALNVVPMAKVPTGNEPSAISGQQSDVRKIILDDKMFIIHNGQMYDATGKRVKQINK